MATYILHQKSHNRDDVINITHKDYQLLPAFMRQQINARPHVMTTYQNKQVFKPVRFI